MALASHYSQVIAHDLLKLLRLYLVMLRYRVAIMLLVFYLLGIAAHGSITVFTWDYVWAALALLSSYIAATTINDINDKEVDRVNHPASEGRPLINGEATERDLYVVHFLAVGASLFFSPLAGLTALGIITMSLSISYIYSVPPIRLSYRTYLAPCILSVAYVFIPYWLGTTVAGSRLRGGDFAWVATLLCLFLGRIVLKDFRDRKGDALYGKPTFLLTHGKSATCLMSFIAILSGNAFSAAILPSAGRIGLLGIVEVYFVAILFMLYRLWRTQDHENEQIAIGIGAKMGNGLLLTLLGIQVLMEYQASLQTQILFAMTTAALYLLNFIWLMSEPGYAVIGYRG